LGAVTAAIAMFVVTASLTWDTHSPTHDQSARQPTPVSSFSLDFDPLGLFAASSPWYEPIPPNPVLDPASRAMVAPLSSDPVADLNAYGIPVYAASATTPRWPVMCTKPWGICPFANQRVAIPVGARPSSGSDAVLVVIDWPAGRIFELWQASRGPSYWRASWGAVVPIGGDGTGGATGSGDSQLAGVVTPAELAAGHIDHALALSSRFACAGAFRYPAIKTDGDNDGHNCLPEGARVQLDPSINVAGLRGIGPAERVIARALQVYGAYVRDSGGAPMAVVFEAATSGTDPYPRLGLVGDYTPLYGIPWNQLRVLRTWNGA
jgi:hypothetical protein